MATIRSWKKAKPGTMLGGKGILIPYKPIPEAQNQAESQPPTDETPNVAAAALAASKPLSLKERNDARMQALISNFNRNVLASQAKPKKK